MADEERKNLDTDGLLYLWQRLKGIFVAKDGSKVLSDNNYTTEEKNKLSAIESGAEVNTIESVKVDGTALTPDANKAVNIDLSGKANLDSPNFSGTPTAPTAASGTSTAQIATTAFVQAAVSAGGVTIDSALSDTSENPVQNKVIKAALDNMVVADMNGATSSAAGAHGLVPAPTAGQQDLFLAGDGTWKMDSHVSSDVATNNADYPVLLCRAKKDVTAPVTGGTWRNTKVYVNPSTGTLTATSFAATSGMTAPTATPGTSDTSVATTAFVANAIATAQTGAAMFQGTVNANSDISNLTDYKKGWYWVVATAGTYVGETCEVGDMIFCISDRDGSYKVSDFSVVQNNLSITPITNAEIDAILAS